MASWTVTSTVSLRPFFEAKERRDRAPSGPHRTSRRSADSRVVRSADRPKPIRDRYAKLQKLHELGVPAYSYSFDPTADLASALSSYEDDREGQKVRVAGRVESLRDMGKSAFAHLGDRSGRLQVYFRRDDLSETEREVRQLLDLGDWIGIEGELFRTRTGEVTVRVERLELLSKSMRPLPLGKTEVTDEGESVVHSGFADVESRYRQRYADLAVNPEVRAVFMTRARVISTLRAKLDAEGYLEVETPVLQPLYGGAFARPFTTYHNSLDRTLFLRIADELYLKRLIVGQLDRVYEISKNFRNEGIDRTHNPEFTMLELYRAFADYHTMMDTAEELVTAAATAVTGGLEITYDGHPVDLSRPWKRVPFFEAIENFAGFDARSASTEELRRRVRDAGRGDSGRTRSDETARHRLFRVGGAGTRQSDDRLRLSHRDEPARETQARRSGSGGALRGHSRWHGAGERLQRVERPDRSVGEVRRAGGGAGSRR